MLASIKRLAILVCFIASAFAQNIDISLPVSGTTVSAGSNLIVRIDKPDSLTGSVEVGLAINLISCADFGGCANFDPTERLGNTLYTGPFNPTYQSGDYYPSENFTVQIPAGFASGEAVLSATHFVLVGASPQPYLQTANDTIIIA
ncbi:uncharacterized protein LAESUDRAFT_696180 [Laetiporus sulphureus 93-53]|uniref:Uncharacterized protein n=1 Tax=Laetiporus sulphureus 93-53 TaxID=1314785 RepID=A0A165FU27_9APHY|nr:uncharacterized protein LAESUDRAFT_696180 [Laetiporus sulphureus 93-53]KZT09412.1 hypothetical protein LAESUDRAFT_696180 [Laetiporus sulphureus 93-53]